MAKKISLSSMLLAISMLFSYIESVIPNPIPIPGIKLGLANLIVLTGIYYLSNKNVFTILVCRIILCGFMFGNMFSIIYSLAGGIISFGIMVFLKRKLSIINVSIGGGIFHNLGQLIVAILIVNNKTLIYYFPILLIAGVVSGMIVGVIGSKILNIICKKGKK